MTPPSSADPGWDRLTASSKAALRWAAALARTRDATAAPDSRDLLAGIVLAHLRDSPPRQAGAHFGIPLGAVLARDDVPPPDPAALLARFRELPQDAAITLGPEVGQVLATAAAMHAREPDGLVSLRMLFGAVLDTATPAAAAWRAQLAARGVDPEAVLASYPKFLDAREPYAAFLRQHHPYRAPATPVPALHPDQPRARRPPPGGADPADLVGIRAEVDSFAHLIASKRLTPPLAVGLFGEWGGGKSYFLRSLQRRVDELVAAGTGRPAGELPFHCSVVQVEYNAWQYVEGDLWSSLLEHLFRNLASPHDVGDDVLAQRRRTVIDRLRETGDRHDAARLERGRLEERRRVAAAQVRRREQEREVTLAQLKRRRREVTPGVEISTAVRDAVGKVVTQAGIDPISTNAEGLRDELRAAGELWRGAGPLLAPLRTAGWRYALALVVLLALTPAVTWLLGRLDLSAVTAAAGGVATLLATLAGYVRFGSEFLRSRLDEITRTRERLDRELAAGRERLDRELAAGRERLDRELAAGRERLDRELAAAQQDLAAVDAALDEAAQAEREIAAEVARQEVTLAETTPGRVLGEFLTERLGSGGYRDRLGVPALIRRDLARLSTLIEKRHADGAADEPGIDRIVLYIDDLDRCPTRLVVDVLQAVHLLLAFPLFVVVVAVDDRWLAHSLREHYGPLDGTGTDPEDFIEKIFQVPFRVRPLDAQTRRRMVTGLLTPSLDARGTAPDPQPSTEGAGTDVAESDLPEFRRVVAAFAETEAANAPWLEAAALTITADELAWVERAAPLLGPTPRAVKRFANTYLLLRSIGRGRGWPTPPAGRLVVLLALATGLPALAEPVLTAVEQAGTAPFPLRDALPDAPDPPGPPDLHGPTSRAAQRARFDRWLAEDPGAATLDVAGLAGWVELVRRFRFHR